jgi:hypothetical protein
MTTYRRDIIAGAALSMFGIFISIYAATQLSLGTFAQMRSGMFPLMAGAAVALLGLAMLVTAVLSERAGHAAEGAEVAEAPEWRSLASVVAAIGAFGLLIKYVGAVPAVFALVLISSLASDKLTFKTALLVAACMSFVTWSVFILGLGLPIEVLDWSF